MNVKTIQLSAPLKFLIVDDSRAIQAIIRRAVIKCGYQPIEIQTALDGEQALDIIERFVPDLIITDWHMPKVSGLEMVQALRQMGHKNVRVGFVTTEKTPAMLDQAISNGALFILHKPFNDAELAEVVMASVKDLAKLVNPEPATPVASPPTPPAKAQSGPVSEAALHKQLQATLGNIPFRLVAGEPMTLATLTPSAFLGLYGSSTSKGAYAVGVLDCNAVCMVGGGAARKAPLDVRAAIEAGQPHEIMLAKATEFLHAMAACMAESAATPSLTVQLARSSMVKSNFSKLTEVLAQSGKRSDFRLAIPGYGEGRMAFFLMTA